MSLYGCELRGYFPPARLMTCVLCGVNVYGESWVCRIRLILIYFISQCSPLFDKISRRSINFIRCCTTHESSLYIVSFIAQYAVNHARMLSSLLGQNALFCLWRYNCSLHDLFNKSVKYNMKYFISNSLSERMRSSASFLFELMLIKDNCLCIGHSGDPLTREELQCLIDYVSMN